MDTRNVKILVVDDEDGIRKGLCEYLNLEGYFAEEASSAEEAQSKGISNYELILLDIMMNGIDGFEFAQKLKQSPETASIPIIVLTAKDSDEDMGKGLRLGADDYISKPFSMKNVLARIEAVMRRVNRETTQVIGVECDRTSLTCRVDGRELKLPRKEFEILSFLLDHPHRVFSREELMKQIWPENVVITDRSVDVHITRIRSKIAPYGKYLISRSGYGYGWQY